MPWQDEMVVILQALLNDFDGTKYNTDNLEKMIVVAAIQVQQELSWPTSYTLNASNATMTPDPTATATKDDSFVNLTTMKAACLIDRGAAAAAASQAIAVKDGSSAIDLKGPMQGALALLRQGWCAAYNDAKAQYLRDRVSTAGAVVMTPFRVYAQGSYGNLIRVPGRDRDYNY